MKGRKPHRRKDGGVSSKEAPLSAFKGRLRAIGTLALIVALCAVVVLAIGRCGRETQEPLEENGSVTTDVERLDADGDGRPDAGYDLSELDEAAEPDGDGWSEGLASAYGLADNDGGDATASGVPLDEVSFTVAVPESRSDLLGATVELYYGGICVEATVTDVGGFAEYGREFDLAPAVWRAFGADSEDEWGVRTVHYRYVLG